MASVEITEGTMSMENGTMNYKSYSYSDGSSMVTITGYTGTDSYILIPNMIGGCPVTRIAEEAFKDNTYIEMVDMPGSNLTYIDDSAFEGCTSLSSVDLPDNLRILGNNAFDSTALDHVWLPDSLTTLPLGGFSNCPNLKSVRLPSALTQMAGYVFYACSALERVYVENGDENITFPSTLTSIGRDCFGGCVSLKGTLTLPEGFKTTNMSIFESCTGLKKLVINEGVTTLGDGAFDDCTALETVYLPRSITSLSRSSLPSTKTITYYL